MELTIPLNYEQLLFLISQMPQNQITKLRADLDKKFEII